MGSIQGDKGWDFPFSRFPPNPNVLVPYPKGMRPEVLSRAALRELTRLHQIEKVSRVI